MADTIKQVQVGTLTYDIEASLLNGSTKDQIINTAIASAQTSRFEVVSSITAANAKQNIIYLVPSANGDNDAYDEYILVNGALEKIGNTDIDLSEYAKKVATTGPSSNSTGPVTGAGSTTTSEVKPYSATSETTTVTISYAKAATVTGSAGSSITTTNTGSVDDHSHSFTGTAATISVAGTAASDGAHTHTVSVNSHEHESAVTAVTGITTTGTAVVTGVTSNGTANAITGITPSTVSIKPFGSAGSLPSLTRSSKTVASGFTVADGVLSLSTLTVQSADSWSPGSLPSAGTAITVLDGLVTPTTTKVLTGVKASGTTTALISASASGTKSVAGAVSTKTLSCTVASAGAHSHSVSATGAYTPAGTISSAGGHSHAYVKLAPHTHSVGSSIASASTTIQVSVPIAPHSHTVGVAAHTHSLNEHTHTAK